MASSTALLFGFVFVLAAMVAVLDADDLRNASSLSHENLPRCTWCVCKDGPEDVLQKSLDYACGHGGDCNPIKPNGACFNPDTVRAHCSYAVNSYYHKMSQFGGTCDFCSSATLTYSDPSSSVCSFPASTASSASSSTPTVPSTTPPKPHKSPPTTPIPGYTPKTPYPYTSTPPFGYTPPTGIIGGGVGPNGMGVYDDPNAGVIILASTSVVLCSVGTLLMLHLWN